MLLNTFVLETSIYSFVKQTENRETDKTRETDGQPKSTEL